MIDMSVSYILMSQKSLLDGHAVADQGFSKIIHAFSWANVVCGFFVKGIDLFDISKVCFS